MENVYDFIIIGAGAAGSVVAARLSENKDYKILILEAGQDNSQQSTNPNMTPWDKALTSIPAFSGILNHRYNNYYPDPSNSLTVAKSLDSLTTIPQGPEGILNKTYSYPRGNGAGGSTNMNALVYGRGDPNIYNDIANYVNDPIWSYENILPYYKKMETYNVPNPEPGIHGYNGWLQIRESGPLTVDLRQELIDSMTQVENIPLRNDPNDPAQLAGVHVCQEQVTNNGIRCNAFENLLYPKMQTQTNITMKFNTLVKNIIIQGNKAVGVVAYEKPFLTQYNTTGNNIISQSGNGTVELPNKLFPISIRYYAKKEVILCAGAIKTPQILMLSGLGPKEHLTEMGIDVIKDIPSVGKNLMDHMECSLIYRMDPSKIIWSWQASYLKQYTYYPTSPYASQILQYGKDNWSEVPTNGVAVMLDWYSEDVVPNIETVPPNIHIHAINGFYYDFCKDFPATFPSGDNYQLSQHQYDDWMPNPNGDATFSNSATSGKQFLINKMIDVNDPYVLLNFLIENFPIPDSSKLGSIRLASTDCRDQPIIDLRLWEDDDACLRLADAILKIRNIMSKSPIKGFLLTENANSEIYPGVQYDTRRKIADYIKYHQAYGHHAAGTARMGSDTDNDSVLDSRLRVKGIKGLRVVDASIYPAPFLHAYNPSCGIYMMAEVASNFIKQEYAPPTPTPSQDNFPLITGRGKYPNNPNAYDARICKSICGEVNNCEKFREYKFGIKKI